MRSDQVKNVGECTGIFSTYPGLSYKTWNPTSTGEHLLAVVLTPYVPAWRVGFSLVAFLGGTDPTATKSPVYATVSPTFNKNTSVVPQNTALMIATTFELNAQNITKWLYMPCDNR